MNMLLMRAGYEPAIIHSTERQRYYEASKVRPRSSCTWRRKRKRTASPSIEKLLEEHETNTRSFVS